MHNLRFSLRPLQLIISEEELDFAHKFLLPREDPLILWGEAALDIAQQDVCLCGLLDGVLKLFVEELLHQLGLFFETLLGCRQHLTHILNTVFDLAELLAHTLLQWFL